jgi:hypothetical protein
VGFLFLPDPTAILYLLQDCSVKRSLYPASVDFRVSIFCIYSGDLLNRLVPDLAPSLRQFTDRLIRLGPGKFFSIFFQNHTQVPINQRRLPHQKDKQASPPTEQPPSNKERPTRFHFGCLFHPARYVLPRFLTDVFESLPVGVKNNSAVIKIHHKTETIWKRPPYRAAPSSLVPHAKYTFIWRAYVKNLESEMSQTPANALCSVGLKNLDFYNETKFRFKLLNSWWIIYCAIKPRNKA